MGIWISDKLVFSISVQQLVDDYVAYRENDIDMITGISLKRWQTIKSQLKHFIKIVGQNTTLAGAKPRTIYTSIQRCEIKSNQQQSRRYEWKNLQSTRVSSLDTEIS